MWGRQCTDESPLCERRDKEGGLMGGERVDRKVVVLELLIFPGK